MMKKIFVIGAFICLGACSVAEEGPDLSLKSSHTIYPSSKYMGTNAAEHWLMGKWAVESAGSGLHRLGDPYTEFSYSSSEGKWMKTTTIGTNKNGEYIIITEGSFKIEEDYWARDSHYIQGSVFRSDALGNILYEEIEKINENEFKVYARGFGLSNPSPDLDPNNPDPKLTKRNFNGLMFTVYKRIK